jgi:hypothetical protein
MSRTPNSPVLHRDDPDKEPLVGNIKVTREDWLNAALDVLVSDGVERVKVLVLASRLGRVPVQFLLVFQEPARPAGCAACSIGRTPTPQIMVVQCARPGG